jgi:hypothetical protein
MSADLIDIGEALEKRRFQQQDERLAKMREAFRAARTDAAVTPPGKSTGKARRRGRPR